MASESRRTIAGRERHDAKIKAEPATRPFRIRSEGARKMAVTARRYSSHLCRAAWAPRSAEILGRPFPKHTLSQPRPSAMSASSCVWMP